MSKDIIITNIEILGNSAKFIINNLNFTGKLIELDNCTVEFIPDKLNNKLLQLYYSYSIDINKQLTYYYYNIFKF
jgi:hypothetical protein